MQNVWRLVLEPSGAALFDHEYLLPLRAKILAGEMGFDQPEAVGRQVIARRASIPERALPGPVFRLRRLHQEPTEGRPIRTAKASSLGSTKSNRTMPEHFARMLLVYAFIPESLAIIGDALCDLQEGQLPIHRVMDLRSL